MALTPLRQDAPRELAWGPDKVFLALSGTPGPHLDTLLRRVPATLGSPIRLHADDGTFVWLSAPGDHDLVHPNRGEIALGADRQLQQVGSASPIPTGSIRWDDTGGLQVVTDWLGFRQVYLSSGSDWAAVSTSALLLGALSKRSLNWDALATLSQMGWLVGHQTVMTDVETVPAGGLLQLRGGRLHLSAPPAGQDDLDAGERNAPALAAVLLREVVNEFWDKNPDALLQLTGGLDSRILLAAVPPKRRNELTALTLRVPGSTDVAIAALLASRDGLRHDVIDLVEPGALTPQEALAVVRSTAVRVQCSADPIALAALGLAEGSISTRTRLSGLGGEVVRGFYYFGPHLPIRPSPHMVRALARWRLFPNESVQAEAVFPTAPEREMITLDQLDRVFDGLGPTWDQATDHFYLWQRMRRWAGVLASALVSERLVVNPMLDRRFIRIAQNVHPREKAGATYLSRILVELDSDLAQIPLDGRSAPWVSAHTSAWNRLTRGRQSVAKATAKARQRISRVGRAPAGGTLLSDLIVAHWRDDPADLILLSRIGAVDERWLAQMIDGTIQPTPATLAYLVNVLVAAESAAPGAARP